MRRAIVALLVALAMACGDAAAATATPPLRMVVIQMKSPSKMYRGFVPLKRYMEARLHHAIELSVAHRSSDMAKLLEKEEIDVVFICPTRYCQLTQRVSLVPLARLRVHGSDEYRSALVVRKDSPIQRTADLMDKEMVFGRYNCPGSGLLPRIMLGRVGLSESDFLQAVHLGNDESARLAVMARMFDVTGIPEMEARRLDEMGLRVLRHSYPIPQYLFAARSGLGEAMTRRLREILLSVNKAPDRLDVLGPIDDGVDGLAPARDRDYDIVRLFFDSVTHAAESGSGLYQGRPTLVVEPLYYDADLFVRLRPLLDRLRAATGVGYHLRIPRSIGDFIALKEADGGDLYLQEASLHAPGRPAGEVALGQVALSSPEASRGVIVAGAGGRVKGIADLKRAKIAITSRHSEGGYLAQQRWLAAKGIDLSEASWVELPTCEAVALAVYRGRADAGFLTRDTLDRLAPDLHAERLRLLAITPPLAPWRLSASKRVDPAQRRAVADSLTVGAASAGVSEE